MWISPLCGYCMQICPGIYSFQYSMPHLWNQLPDDIRECSSLDQFKSLLKSHLFVK